MVDQLMDVLSTRLLAINIFLHVYYWPSEAANSAVSLLDSDTTVWPKISKMTLHNYIDSCAIPISLKLDRVEQPICVKKLLERRDMYSPTGRQFMSTDRRRNGCQLLHYTPKDATICIDILNKDIKKNYLRFVFIGDSRIRQQLYNFLKIIPEYDLEAEPNLNLNRKHHSDINVISNMLNLQISDFWHPLITNETVKIIREMSISHQTDAPYFIIFSISSHYMIPSNGGHELYKEKLIELSSLFSQFKNTRVIWLNQYPSIDFYGDIHAHNTEVFADKIHQYNEASRRILAKQKGVRIWDSGNPLAEEYVRSCAFAKRRASKDYAFSYFNCEDYIHTGYAALSDSTQILFNDICNGPILKHACYNHN